MPCHVFIMLWQVLPGGLEGDVAAKALVTAFFLVTSIKSRIFRCDSPLRRLC